MLLRIVACGSIQGASRQMGVTRASVRRVLESLEAEIGAPLLHRHGKGVQLTPTGTVVVEQGRAVVEACRGLLLDARAAVGQATGVLRVVEPVGLPLSLHARLLRATHEAFPHQAIALRLVEDPLTTAHEPFEVMLHEGPPPDRAGWFSRVVLRATLRLRASPSYLRSRGTPTDVAALTGHDLLGWKRPGHPPTEWPLLAGGVVKVTPWLTSPDPQVLYTVAAAGGGILLAPDLPFVHEAGEEPLQEILGDVVGGEVVMRVSTPFSTRTDSRTRETLKLILDQLALLPEG